MKLRGYVYRIYPTEEQQVLIRKTIGCSRFVYNHMLAESIAAHENGLKFFSRNAFNYRLTSLKKEYPWLAEVDATALTAADDDLADAFDRFFKKLCRFPKFHKKSRSGSYTSKCVNGNIKIGPGYIRLPKIGYVKAVIHRIPDCSFLIRSATVRQSANGIFEASVLLATDEPLPDDLPVREDRVIGLDYKSDGLYTDSNGDTLGMPHYYRESAKRLRREQKKLSHMIESHITGYKTAGRGRIPVYDRPLDECRNIQKQMDRVARIHRHTANQRRDFLHKESAAIAKRYDYVCVEDLNMKAISNKGFGNGKATLDNGYGLFLAMLGYKLADKGGRLVAIDRWFPSSQLCHSCGELHPEMKDLRIRRFACDCGYTSDRDHNAARNIRAEGLRLLAV